MNHYWAFSNGEFVDTTEAETLTQAINNFKDVKPKQEFDGVFYYDKVLMTYGVYYF